MRSALALLCLVTTAHAADLPDPILTPGNANPTMTAEAICAPGFWAGAGRSVPASVRREVFTRYGMSPTESPCPCEVDHLIPLELGGSNDMANLWPQSLTTRWNARIKDRLENRLHREVCAGAVSLEQAQRAIATDWIAAWMALFRAR